MHPVLRRLLKLFLLIPAWIRLGSGKWAWRLAEENIPYQQLDEFSMEGACLRHKKTGLFLDEKSFPLVKGGLKYWLLFSSYPGVTRQVVDNDCLLIDVDNVSFRVRHHGSLFIIHEIFAEKLYDLWLKEDVVVLDIGMNVGVASLFFATKPWVTAVIGYEPLPDTYKEAVTNISCNPALSAKVSTVLAGVSNRSGSITVPQTVAGSAVFSTDPDFITAHSLKTTAQGEAKVDLIDIMEIFDKVRSGYPGRRILLKLDCEGEEYKILDSLTAGNQLPYVAAIAMEWHVKGFEQLCQSLYQSGFQIFNLGRIGVDPPAGMIYAFNMNKL